jgi:magnesium-transporting ATPase (P-type)
MLDENLLVRDMSVLERVGHTTVLITDSTGTLTMNK